MAASIIGSADHGAVLFGANCVSCHGADGTGRLPNPGSKDGTVPALKPLSRALFRSEPQVFAENIDRFIQHGSVPAGPSPALNMPAFGDTHARTQHEIADIEAYILQLNGVDRAQLAHPRVAPRRYLQLVVAIFALAALRLGLLWIQTRARLRRSPP